MLQEVRKNVGSIGPEIRAKILADIGLRDFLKVLGDLPFGIAPGEICIGLRKSELG